MCLSAVLPSRWPSDACYSLVFCPVSGPMFFCSWLEPVDGPFTWLIPLPCLTLSMDPVTSTRFCLSTVIRPGGTVLMVQAWPALELPLTPSSDLFVGQLHFYCSLTHGLTVSLKHTIYNGSHWINICLSLTLTSHSSWVFPISCLQSQMPLSYQPLTP